MTTFTYRSAQSGALLGGIVLALAVETVVLHLLVTPRHPIIGWLLTSSSLGVIVWLVADYRALGRGVVRIVGDTIDLRIGRRFNVQVPIATVTSSIRPTWRDVPMRGTPAAEGYLNLMKPAGPNVLLMLSAPVDVKLPGGMHRAATKLGLCLDAPDEFLAALPAYFHSISTISTRV